jgi:hypothetical protein
LFELCAFCDCPIWNEEHPTNHGHAHGGQVEKKKQKRKTTELIFEAESKVDNVWSGA